MTALILTLIRNFNVLCHFICCIIWTHYISYVVLYGHIIFLSFSLDDMERLRQQDKDTINRQNQQLADYESELNMLRRRVNGLEQDLEHEANENKRLQEELFKTVQVELH